MSRIPQDFDITIEHKPFEGDSKPLFNLTPDDIVGHVRKADSLELETVLRLLLEVESIDEFLANETRILFRQTNY